MNITSTFQEVLANLELIIGDPDHQANGFAHELTTNIKQYFSFCLEPGPGYLVQYAAATYLSPQHKLVLSPSELTLAKEYLLSKYDTRPA